MNTITDYSEFLAGQSIWSAQELEDIGIDREIIDRLLSYHGPIKHPYWHYEDLLYLLPRAEREPRGAAW